MPDGGLGRVEVATKFRPGRRAALRRIGMAAVFVAAAIAGSMATTPHEAAGAIAAAGPDLTRLLRGMATIKAAAALGVAAAVLWRLALPASTWRLAAYGAAGAAMAAGPCLIWDMALVGLGALLLHAGLLATAALLWRDPAMAARLEGMVLARRKARLLF